MKAILRGGLALAGVLMIAVIVRRTGWPGVRANLHLIGPWVLVLLALNLVTQAAFVLGLRSVLEPTPAWRDFPRLYGVYLMGDAGNYLVPGSGEAAKAHLLRRLGGGPAALAAVALHKHADLVAQCTFAVAGVGAALACFRLPRPIAIAALTGTLVLLLALLLVTRALASGAFAPVLARLSRLRFLAARLQRFHAAAEAVDARIVAFHTAHPGRFLAAAGLSFLGYCGGWLEAAVVLRLLAPGAAWPASLAVEGLPMVLNTLVLFVPGKLGGAEGIRTGVFLLIGLSASQGAAYALLRRTRELVWVVPGWTLLARERLRGRERSWISPLREEATGA